MGEFEYLKKQDKNIEKKYDELMAEYNTLKREGEIQIFKKKYDELLKKKKLGKIDWADEMMIDIYQDAIEIEKHEK